MASNPLFIIPDFFCIFPMNFAMGILGLKEMGKSVPSWLSQFSCAKLKQPTGPTCYSILRVDAMRSFPQKPVFNQGAKYLEESPWSIVFQGAKCSKEQSVPEIKVC
jgi:hypothetical protein